VVEIKIINLNKKYKLNEARLKKIIRDVLKYLRKSGAAEFEFVFLDDRSIRRLNKKYKNTDRATDVLSFRLDRDAPGGGKFLGNIFISVDRAFANAGIFSTGPENELVLYVIHGILHLFGYDDETPVPRRRMRDKERKVLDGVCRNLSGVLTPR
jgi:probable rRNA maturation factor